MALNPLETARPHPRPLLLSFFRRPETRAAPPHRRLLAAAAPASPSLSPFVSRESNSRTKSYDLASIGTASQYPPRLSDGSRRSERRRNFTLFLSIAVHLLAQQTQGTAVAFRTDSSATSPVSSFFWRQLSLEFMSFFDHYLLHFRLN
ncbi:hypothetical protein JCGZ_13808 [Jatropha curcas]|uniref:Uncharacterized protein n=1 Tax=Jatropha curcas TaxID=180498 RepID=A0A067K7K7_JATCU|nr:hypothetical protein JCGZ_13808 [Jatropha curcas]